MKPLFLLLFLTFSSGLFAQQLEKTDHADELRVYPNPVSGELVNILSPEPGPKVVHVYDVFGKIVLRDRINSVLPVDKLPPGVYLIKVQQGTQSLTRKLIVK